MAADERLAQYEVRRPIGKGSYGEVFLVTRRGDSKKYVMKNIKLTASRASERHAAEQEASLLSRLKHPNIVSYIESFQDSRRVLRIVMAYCEGGDLCSRLKARQGRLLSEKQVVEWFVQIALALQYLHERNILHRDLKTQNIFLSKNSIIKVGDLGIARVLEGSCDLAETVVGTPYYMSPELFSNKPYNHKSDVWALGCCVYEMATLRHPFSAHNINALMVKIVKGQAPVLPQQFSRDLSGLVRHLLSRDAAQRPSVHQLLRKEYIRTHIKLFLERAASRQRRKIRPQKVSETKTARGQESPSPSLSPRKLSVNCEGLVEPPLEASPSGLSLARERRRQRRQDVGRGRRSADQPLREAALVAVSGSGAEKVVKSGSGSSMDEEEVEGGCGGEAGREEAEFYTLLDSTLHCEQSTDSGCAAEEMAGLHPGRLQERIAALRRECEAGLGQEVVGKALSSLDLLDSDTDPDMKLLLPVLGHGLHERYAPKLRQLWLCEDALRDHHE